jgi:hypothetical protein
MLGNYSRPPLLVSPKNEYEQGVLPRSYSFFEGLGVFPGRAVLSQAESVGRRADAKRYHHQ